MSPRGNCGCNSGIEIHWTSLESVCRLSLKAWQVKKKNWLKMFHQGYFYTVFSQAANITRVLAGTPRLILELIMKFRPCLWSVQVWGAAGGALFGLCGQQRNEPCVMQKWDNCMSFLRGHNTQAKNCMWNTQIRSILCWSFPFI